VKPETMTVTKRTCTRCGHQWWPRMEEPPRICPKCKSPYWDVPRRADTEKPEG
jgi:predicted Zn-ribbon and HTH transcriptional regulator